MYRGVPKINWCAYYGDVTAIRFLLANGQPLAALGQNIGLNAAAFHGHWQLCEFLTENGADVNFALPDTGETALHAALCKANRPAYDMVVRVLIAAGANPNAVTKPSVPTVRSCAIAQRRQRRHFIERLRLEVKTPSRCS